MSTTLPLIHALYLEPDPQIARLMTRDLAAHGVQLHVLAHAEGIVADVDRLAPDILLLELAGGAGLEACRLVRERHALPIVITGVRAAVPERVRAFELGADDFVAKPFIEAELVARLRAHVRRARGHLAPAVRKRVGPMLIDTTTRTVTLRDATVKLTTNELAILTTLARQPGRVVSRDHLLRAIHGSSAGATARSIDVLVSRLRSKLEVDAQRPRLLLTARRAGYVLSIGGDDAG